MRTQVVKNIEKEFLEPSFRYLVNNGLENTSVRDLCKAMEISYGSIYYWFDGKEDIYINVVKYGTGVVANALFSYAFENLKNPDVFFENFLDEVDKYKLELRLIFQVTTSPVYGNQMREKAFEFNDVYAKYINKLSDILRCDPEELVPLIYLLISVMVDYIIWEDTEISKMQLKFIYNQLAAKLK